MTEMSDSSSTRIPLLSHDKPGGRPLRSYRIDELSSAFLPEIYPSDVLILVEEEIAGFFREDDILLVRRETPERSGSKIVLRLYGDALYPERMTADAGVELSAQARQALGPRSEEAFGTVLAVVREL